MNKPNEILPPADGEAIEEVTDIALIQDSRLVAEMLRAEISQQIATARQFRRSVKRATDNILTLATLDEEAAQEAIYSLPRGKNPILGPSIRLAEICQQQWGNNRCASRIVQVDRENKVVVAEGVFHDLETNAAVKATVQRRIVDARGRIYSDDMVIVTGNAASSIARRNAIFAGVPKAVWRRAFDACLQVVRGDAKTLVERRSRAVKAFSAFGVKPELVYAALAVAGEEEITLEHLPVLFGMFQSLKNGETTVEELFNSRQALANRSFEKVDDPLAGGPAPKEKKNSETAARADAEAGARSEAGERTDHRSPADEKPDAQTASQAAQTADAAAKPGEERRPAEHEGAAGSGEGAAPPSPLETARQRGREAFAKGMARRAVPPEYRGEDRAAEAEAWRHGFDEAKSEADQGAGS